MKLEKEQKDVIFKLLKFDQPIQTLGGYAGTGKTTVIYHLSLALPKVAVCAYTGKAANVLRKKGVPASTIHSLIYNPVVDYHGNVHFELHDSLDCDAIIVDEASMVGESLQKDLNSFGLPIIYVGDHGQLEPVESSQCNLMQNPMYRLESIHRNAGEIAHFAEFVRKGFKSVAFQHQYRCKQISFLSKREASNHLLEVDQTICAYNKTRVDLNNEVREKLGVSDTLLIPGEKVMCLRNKHMDGVFNGMQGEVLSLLDERKMLFESNGQNYELHFDPDQFGQAKYDFKNEGPHPFDYAYAITCHKAQGDEWDKVMVYEQKCDLWDHKRWAYTAASRAKSSIFWVE